jgi:hypothetical protein
MSVNPESHGNDEPEGLRGPGNSTNRRRRRAKKIGSIDQQQK